MFRRLHRYVTRKRRFREAVAERQAAQAELERARERKDSRAMSAASTRLQRATLALMRLEQAP